VIFENVDELQLLNDAMEASNAAWWIMELPSGVIFFHQNKIQNLGYNKKEIEKFTHYTSFTHLIHRDDHDMVMKAMSDYLAGKTESYEASYCIVGKDGKYHHHFDRGRIVAKNGDTIVLSGVVVDIPEKYLTSMPIEKSPSRVKQQKR
jgi:PAS domain S-box-containing protein